MRAVATTWEAIEVNGYNMAYEELGHRPQRPDWLAGVVRLELRNLSARNPFELRRGFLSDLAKRMFRDVSSVSGALATLQLWQGFWQVVSSARPNLHHVLKGRTRAGRRTRTAEQATYLDRSALMNYRRKLVGRKAFPCGRDTSFHFQPSSDREPWKTAPLW